MFTGPPGVGKTVVARLACDIYRSLHGAAQRPCRRSGVSCWVGRRLSDRPRPRRLMFASSALDGILFIDEAYALSEGSRPSGDFGKLSVRHFAEIHGDTTCRIIVIVAGYPKSEIRPQIYRRQPRAGKPLYAH